MRWQTPVVTLAQASQAYPCQVCPRGQDRTGQDRTGKDRKGKEKRKQDRKGEDRIGAINEVQAFHL